MKITIYSIILIVSSFFFIKLANANQCNGLIVISMPTSVENHRVQGLQNVNTILAMANINKHPRCQTDRFDDGSHIFESAFLDTNRVSQLPETSEEHTWGDFARAAMIDSSIERQKNLVAHLELEIRNPSSRNLPRAMLIGLYRSKQEAVNKIADLRTKQRTGIGFPMCTRNRILKFDPQAERFIAEDHLVHWGTSSSEPRSIYSFTKVGNLGDLPDAAQFCMSRPMVQDVTDCQWTQVEEHFVETGTCNPFSDADCAPPADRVDYQCGGQISCKPRFIGHSNAGAEIILSNVKCKDASVNSCGAHNARSCFMDALNEPGFDQANINRVYPGGGDNSDSRHLQALMN